MAVLRRWIEAGPPDATTVRRARIVLLSGEGLGPSAVATEVGCSKQTVITWRERFRADGIDGLRDAPRSGRPVTVDQLAVLERTLQPPPPRLRAGRWSSRLLAGELGISNVAVANVWRAWGVVTLADGHVRLATTPPLDPPIDGVAGLHVGPTLRAMALVAGGSGDPARVPLGRRPRLGRRFDQLDPGEGTTPPGPTAFLDGLDHLEVARHGRLRLLVNGETPDVRRWAAPRAADVHVVPPGLAWTRLARIAVVLAGGTAHGAGTVARLRRAVVDHVPGRPLVWHDSEAI